MNKQGQIKISDFGLSSELKSESKKTKMLKDIKDLGVLLFEMMYQRLPIHEDYINIDCYS